MALWCLFGAVHMGSAFAAPIFFTLDTSVLAGSNGTLAFDFIGDNGNTVTITNFQAAGASSGTSVGAVSGTLPGAVTLMTGPSFFNEATVAASFGGLITFQIDMTQNAGASGASPDALSLFFLDSLTGQPLFSTGDPTGANALFLWNIDGGLLSGLNIYQSAAVSILALPGGVPAPVPEPASVLLILPLLALIVVREYRARMRRAVIALGVVALAGMSLASHAADLAGKVSVTKSGMVLNRTTDTFDSVVTVTNTSSGPISAPLMLTIKNISAPGVTVYNSSGFDADDNAQVQATLPMGVLQPGAKVAVPVKFVNATRVAFDYAVDVSATPLDASNSVPLTVRVHAFSGNADNPVGPSAGAGVKLYVDGVMRGVTNAAGQATLMAQLDWTSISATRPPSEVGTANLQIDPAQANSVTVVMAEDAEVYADGALRIDQVKNLLLPNTFGAFSMRFVTPGEATAPVVDLALVELYNSVGESQGNITDMFVLGSDGVIRPVNVSALRNLFLSKTGKLALKVTALDAQHNVYLGEAALHLTSHQVSGRFTAPASFPGLQLGGIRIVGKILNTDIVVSTVSAADGSFAFPRLPAGNLSYTSQTFQNGRFYYGSGTVALTGVNNITVPLLSAADTSPAGFAALSSAMTQAAASSTEEPRPQGLVSSKNAWPALPETGMMKSAAAAAAPASATVSVTAGARDAVISQTAALTVPKGTKKVTLTYNVGTAEYPYYVTAQSIYNDVWGIKLFAGAQGSQIFEITRQVNSQLTQDPVWRADGTTGLIEKTFDVANLAKDADIELTLSAFTTNIGDSQLATTVNARVEAGGKLSINTISFVPNAWVAHNNNTYFSVPASGDLNRFHRKMTLDITKPDDATISNLKVEALAGGATGLAVDEAPGTDVTVVNDTTMRSVVTFKSNSSTINGAPPPSNALQYRYTLTAKAADGSDLSDEKIDSNKRPLWRMPPGFTRYSVREPGFDDWASHRTYQWMQNNANLLTAINDVSGEHGKDIGHSTHAKGSDIDMYHFYLFAGADPNNGTSNYTRLVARVNDLPKMNSTNPVTKAAGQAAAAEVVAWINASRAGIDALAADPDVLQVGYIRSGPNPGAISGASWGSWLLTTGRVTVNGTEFNLGTGNWANAKFHAWANHHHHVHVTLNPAD